MAYRVAGERQRSSRMEPGKIEILAVAASGYRRCYALRGDADCERANVGCTLDTARFADPRSADSADTPSQTHASYE